MKKQYTRPCCTGDLELKELVSAPWRATDGLRVQGLLPGVSLVTLNVTNLGIILGEFSTRRGGFSSVTELSAFDFRPSERPIEQQTRTGLFEEINVIPGPPVSMDFPLFPFEFHKLPTSSHWMYSWRRLCFRESSTHAWHEHNDISPRRASRLWFAGRDT